MKQTLYARFIKRLLDLMISGCVLLLLSPVYAILAILVRIKLGKPVLFCQERPGKDEKIFRLYKFRTMTDARDANGELLDDAARLTRFGQFLRRTSLDELPEFYNIFRGDMSLIGPRPLLVEYLPLYSTHQKHRHDVRPGLSGLAQAHGRNLLSWEERFDLDVQYVQSVSFKNDLAIVLATIKGLVKEEGISSETSVTMEPFHGNPQEIHGQERAKI